MPGASTSDSMSPKLLKVAERARREPEGLFHSLAHLIDVDALRRAFDRQRPEAAAGVDGVTKEQYGQDLEDNLQSLLERLKSMKYRHQPVRRVHIPKGKGKRRPIGILAFEDKLVQDAIREVLEVVYEPVFSDCSYGFRPRRRAHDALRRFDKVAMNGGANWVLEADLKSFFDSLDRKKLLEILQTRVPDGSLLRLVSKCLQAGVLDGEAYSRPSAGTPQGSPLSPLLGNIYLHTVLDRWFERTVTPELSGRAKLIRYADDFIICFSRKADAVMVLQRLSRRLADFGLSLHPDKTRLLPFGRPARGVTKGKSSSATFDFLGFTMHWQRSRRGFWRVAMKTRSGSLGRFVRAVRDWCRRHRHESIQDQHAALVRRVNGHVNYFGVQGNIRCLRLALHCVERAWFTWLTRRSQRSRLTWKRFGALLRAYPLPRPRIVVPMWGGVP